MATSLGYNSSYSWLSTFHELVTVSKVLQAKLTYPNSLTRDILLSSHFTDENTDAQENYLLAKITQLVKEINQAT